MIDECLFNECFYPLAKYINLKDIVVSQSDGCIKYQINLKQCKIEISYYVIDEYYRIKLENNIDIYSISFLTKSRKFKRDIKKILKKYHMERKFFKNHIAAFCLLLNELLNERECFVSSIEKYKTDLKFDGLFLRV